MTEHPPESFVDLSGDEMPTTTLSGAWWPPPCPEDKAMCSRLAGGFYWVTDLQLGLVVFVD